MTLLHNVLLILAYSTFIISVITLFSPAPVWDMFYGLIAVAVLAGAAHLTSKRKAPRSVSRSGRL